MSYYPRNSLFFLRESWNAGINQVTGEWIAFKATIFGIACYDADCYANFEKQHDLLVLQAVILRNLSQMIPFHRNNVNNNWKLIWNQATESINWNR